MLPIVALSTSANPHDLGFCCASGANAYHKKSRPSATLLAPDCVLLDYYLPDMNATEVLTELRGGSELPPCPVVVLTGSDVRVGSSVLRAGALYHVAGNAKSTYVPKIDL